MWTGRVARLAKSPRVSQVTTVQQATSQCTVRHKVWWKPSSSTRNDSDEKFRTRDDEPLVRLSGSRHVISRVNQFFCCARSHHWRGHCSLCDARAEPQKSPHQVEKPGHQGTTAPSFRRTIPDELCPIGAKTKIAASVEHGDARHWRRYTRQPRSFIRVRQAMQHERPVCVRRCNTRDVVCESQQNPSDCWQSGCSQSIRRHQWSALSVPLLWAASARDRDHLVVQWLLEVSSRTPALAVAGIDMSGFVAAATG